jgi:hypothetical protein
MIKPGNPPPPDEPSPGTDALLRELIDTLKPRPHRFRRILIWILIACAAPVVGAYAVPGAHHVFTTARCYGKYLLQSREERLPSSAWHPFGVTSVKAVSMTAVSVRASALSDTWYGALIPLKRYCDYRVSFSAQLVGPWHPAYVGVLGYGYAVGLKGTAVNGIPNAVTAQYDPLFGGLRTVPIPCCADKPGYNPRPILDVSAERYHRWSVMVSGDIAYVSLDGRGYGEMTLGDGDDILLRVWNATVNVKDVVVRAVRPWG